MRYLLPYLRDISLAADGGIDLPLRQAYFDRITYSDLVLPDTGEHLTKERFDELHKSSTTRSVTPRRTRENTKPLSPCSALQGPSPSSA